MIQDKIESAKSRMDHIKTETIVQRQRDPRLARQMQFQNAAQRNFPQRNRGAPPAPAIQRFGLPPTSFVSNNPLDNNIANRPTTAFNGAIMDDSGRQSRPISKNRSSSKDLKNRLTSKTSPKTSHKSNNQKSQSSKTATTPTKSSPSSKTSKTSSKVTSASNNRSSSKELKKVRYKEKDISKLSPSRNSAIVPLAEGEKKIKEYTIPFKKRSPSPKDKSTKSITDPKVSSTTKTADSPVKFKGGKANSKSRNYVRRNRDESPIPNKDGVEVTPPSPPMSSTSTTTTSELITSPIPPLIEPLSGSVSSVPFAGVGENQSFKSKNTTFIVRMVKISHIVHSLLTRLMISIRLINYCINHRDDILNKLIVIGTGDNFFIKTFCRFFFQLIILRFLTI